MQEHAPDSREQDVASSPRGPQSRGAQEKRAIRGALLFRPFLLGEQEKWTQGCGAERPHSNNARPEGALAFSGHLGVAIVIERRQPRAQQEQQQREPPVRIQHRLGVEREHRDQ